MASIDVEEANIMIATDEERIKARYKNNVGAAVLNIAVMLGVAYEFDVKWVVAGDSASS